MTHENTFMTRRYSVFHDDKPERLQVLLSKTKGVTIKISKYCAGCFPMNINHLIFVHHIVFSISQYQYVDSYIWPSFIEILGRD